MQAARWLIAFFATIVVGAVAGVVSVGLADLDDSTAATVAAGVTAVAIVPLAAWAGSKTETTAPIPVPLPASIPGVITTDGVLQVRRLRQMPSEAVEFQSRDAEMDRLAVMAGTGRTVVVCALAGQRGVGKTQLAAAYARDRIQAGWPVVIWIAAETAAGVADEFAMVAQAMGLAPAGAETGDAARAGLDWLGSHPGPCLLVFDNAVDPDLVRQWIPPAGAVQTVVTTNRRDFANLGVLVDVGLFTIEQALTYLRARTGLTDDGGAATLAEQLGRLPVALAQAGAIIGPGRPYPSYQHYLDQLDALDLDRLLPHTTGDPYPHGAAQAILLALHHVQRDDPRGHARRLLEYLAVLSPTGVDQVLLQHLLDQPPVTGRAGWLRRWRRTREGRVDVAAIASALVQRSLTRPAQDAGQVVMHRLVQRVIRDHQRRAGQLDNVITAAAEAISAAADEIGNHWDSRTLVADYAEHLQALVTRRAGPRTMLRLLRVRLQVFYLLSEIRSSIAAIPFGVTLVADCEQVLGPDHPDTLHARKKLAAAYLLAGRLGEANPLLEATLADCERVLGRDHPDTLHTRNNLAYAYRSSGRLDEAIKLHQAALADFERVLGPNHPNTLTSRNNLAYAYRSSGRLDEAIKLHLAALADFERVLGPNHPNTLATRNDLADAYRSAERSAEAIPMFEVTLADCKRVLGLDHPETLATRNNLGAAYDAAGRPAEAIPLLEVNLADSERVLGLDHPSTLHARNNLAGAYQSAGRLGEAIPLLEAALAGFERVLGLQHPETLGTRNNLGGAYGAVGRLGEGIPLLEATLADFERVLGPDHPNTLHARNNLADAYRPAGRLGEAIPLLEATLDGCERVLGPDHPDTLRARNNLAYAHEQQQKRESLEET